MQRHEMTRELLRFGTAIIENNVDFISKDTLHKVQELLFSRDKRVGMLPERRIVIERFLTENKSDWALHCKIAAEALELFSKSEYFREIRYRLVACLAHPSTMVAIPELLDLDTITEEWREKFMSYLTLQITFVFLTVDWIKVFSQG